jgi:hypothetical protein
MYPRFFEPNIRELSRIRNRSEVNWRFLMRLFALGLVCAAAVSAANTGSTQVTFYKDVLPVLAKNCQSCHRAGEAGPMSFMSYDSTRPWAKAIKTAVLTKKMPPWFADPHYGNFANDRRMAQSEIDTLVAWADAGAKAGNASDAPPPARFTDGWGIPNPDVVIEMPQQFEIPASGTIDYQYIVIPTNFTEDKYVQFAEARPGDRERVHHIIAFIREPGSPWLKDAKPGIPFVPAKEVREQAEKDKQQGEQAQRRRDDGGGFGGDFLAGYAPGAPPQSLRPGQAKLVKAGSDLVLQMHYTANGKAGVDKSRIGLVFAKEHPTQRILTLAAANNKFAIPPGDPNYEVDSKIQLQQETTLTNLLPHMHFRGKDFEYRAVYPSGEKEVLLRVPKYDFNWQLWYVLDKPKVLPAGTVIECTAHFDNSPNNPANPDPTKTVKFGEQTWDEMMIGFFDVAVDFNTSPIDILKPKKKASGD